MNTTATAAPTMCRTGRQPSRPPFAPRKRAQTRRPATRDAPAYQRPLALAVTAAPRTAIAMSDGAHRFAGAATSAFCRIPPSVP